MLRVEEVDAEDIADVVSRWTGIPVNKMLQSEREKLRSMDEHRKKLDSAIKELRKLIKGNKAGASFSAKTTALNLPVVGGKVKLYKGNVTPASVTSPYSLYDEEIATFAEDDVYDRKDADGFINLFGLSLKVRAMVKENAEK